jgi:hypothetical protein
MKMVWRKAENKREFADWYSGEHGGDHHLLNFVIQ